LPDNGPNCDCFYQAQPALVAGFCAQWSMLCTLVHNQRANPIRGRIGGMNEESKELLRQILLVQREQAIKPLSYCYGT
jgi:hypothetical protein